MPIFEYKCTKCDTNFEELVFGSQTVVVCPECKSDKIEKQLSSFAASTGSISSSTSSRGNSSGCGSSGFG